MYERFQIGSNSVLEKRSAQQVLDGFLPQVVVDAEHRMRGEYGVDESVEFPGAGQVMAEGFFNDDPSPRIFGAFR